MAERAVIVDDHLRQRLIAEVAAELECSPEEVMAGLYADLSGNQRLVAFEEMSAEESLQSGAGSGAALPLFRDEAADRASGAERHTPSVRGNQSFPPDPRN
jgi:hypothetical protein